jgi:hypothetical protein
MIINISSKEFQMEFREMSQHGENGLMKMNLKILLFQNMKIKLPVIKI